MRKFFFLIIITLLIASCSEKQDTAYSGIRVGVSKERYNEQIDSLINISKLTWQEGRIDGHGEKIAYATQTIRKLPLYFL